jgi:lipopolysaccharide biosynthesis regulator YciM
VTTGTTWFFWLGLLLITGLLLFALSRTPRRPKSNGDHFTKALSQLIHDDWDGALDSLRATIRSGQASPDAYLKLGSLLRRRGEHLAAYQIHQTLTVRQDLDPATRVELLRCLVDDLRALGRRSDALQALRELAQHVRGAAIQREMADEALASGEYAAAVEAFREAQKADATLGSREAAAFLASVAERCTQRDRVNQAKTFLQQALKEDSNCEAALIQLGDLAYQEGDHESAIYYWQKLAFATPATTAELLERLEKVYFDLGRFDDVERVYDQILEKRPRDLHALIASARIAMKKGESDTAESMLRQARDLDPAQPAAFEMLAELYLDAGRSTDVRELIGDFVQAREPRVRGGAA